MTSTTDPVPLAEALKPIHHLLGDLRFIGRYDTDPDTDPRTGSRWYVDPDDPDTRYQSITWTIGSTESSPWLMPWAAKLTAEQAAAHWADLGDMAAALGWPAVVAFIRDEGERQRQLAAEVGVWHHDVLEALLLDAPIPDPSKWILGRTLTTGGERMVITQEVLDSWADGLLHFVQDYRLVPVMAEATVCNTTEGYAGRIDVGAEFPGHGTGLVDLKTGRPRQSVMAQLTAAMHATEVWLPGGVKVPMPRFEWGAVLHLRRKWARGYKLRRVPTGPEQWDLFRTANRLLILREDQPDLDRLALYPPTFDTGGAVVTVPTVPMIEDTGWRCATALNKAGLTWVTDLTCFTVDDVRGVRGVGPKAIEAITETMTRYGLTFQE